MSSRKTTGKTTEGTARGILTDSATDRREIKVPLEGGQVGRMKEILG